MYWAVFSRVSCGWMGIGEKEEVRGQTAKAVSSQKNLFALDYVQCGLTFHLNVSTYPPYANQGL